MGELTRTVEARRQNVLTGDDVEIAETMSEMNRLLHEINDFFARGDPEDQPTDFTGPHEQEKFQQMEKITDDEISRTDWDKLIDRLRGDE